MIYLPSPEAVAHEIEGPLAITEAAALAIVTEVYAAIDRCTTQRVTVDESAPNPNPKA
jgi:hypothetical protein